MKCIWEDLGKNLGPPKNILSLGFEFLYLHLTTVTDYINLAS